MSRAAIHSVAGVQICWGVTKMMVMANTYPQSAAAMLQMVYELVETSGGGRGRTTAKND